MCRLCSHVENVDAEDSVVQASNDTRQLGKSLPWQAQQGASLPFRRDAATHNQCSILQLQLSQVMHRAWASSC